jgi:hypothetical protein
MGIEEVEEIQTKGIDNVFDRIIGETSLTLRKRESSRYKKLTEHQTIRIKKNMTRHIIIKTFNIQDKEKVLKIEKREKTSHILRQTH